MWLLFLLFITSSLDAFDYAHLKWKKQLVSSPLMRESDYFLVILVDARQLDYTSAARFLNSMVKHRDGTKNGEVGHAWLYLQGKGEVIEGGHTGEYGVVQPKYVQGLMQKIAAGEENPAAYLYETLRDGEFQKGSGGHRPTFAAKIDLTEEQFEKLCRFIRHYNFQEYSLTSSQCVTFVCLAAQCAGLDLEGYVTMKIDPVLNGKFKMWSDPAYGELTVGSPDCLERSLVEAVKEGRAEYALGWYRYHHGCPGKGGDIRLIPSRLRRVINLRVL